MEISPDKILDCLVLRYLKQNQLTNVLDDMNDEVE